MDTKKNKTIIAVLACILVLLVVAIVVIYKQRTASPEVADVPTSSTASTTTTSTTDVSGKEQPATGDQMPASMGDGSNSFDVKTATKVPAGETPEAYLERYFRACEAKQWDTAYNMLPLAKKTSYKNAEAFGKQLSGYGISGHEVSVKSKSDTEIVLSGVTKTASYGDFAYLWTFTKVDGQWYVKSRTMSS